MECFKLVVLFLVDQLLLLIESALMYFNKYAFCYVAAYGDSFMASGEKVVRLFTRRGWLGIINDNLISNVLFLGMIICAVLNAAVGAIAGTFLGPTLLAWSDSPVGTCAVIGGVAGSVIGLILSSALDAGVSMVFVCFAEGEEALQKNHPREHAELSAAWNECYPTVAVRSDHAELAMAHAI
jgi:hypothetical protein